MSTSMLASTRLNKQRSRIILKVAITALVAALSLLLLVASAAAKSNTTPVGSGGGNAKTTTTTSFHIAFEGRPDECDARNALTLTFCLNTVSYTVNSDECGDFTMDLEDGTYHYSVKNAKYLAGGGTFVVPASGTVDLGELDGGDANNNNVVNAVDASILYATFGKGYGDPGYDDRADFNGDLVVNSVDFNILRDYYGIGGATLCPSSLSR